MSSAKLKKKMDWHAHVEGSLNDFAAMLPAFQSLLCPMSHVMLHLQEHLMFFRVGDGVSFGYDFGFVKLSLPCSMLQFWLCVIFSHQPQFQSQLCIEVDMDVYVDETVAK